MVEATGDLHVDVVGRDEELVRIREFLGPGARDRPAALVLEGEAGIGKTALWRAALGLAGEHGFRVLTATPAASERGLPFAGLRDLFGDAFAELAPELPAPQRRAFAVALLEEEAGGTPPPQSAICAAALSTTRLLAQEQPLLIAVDDVQWLDRPSERVLQFVTRRLAGEAVAVLLARRMDEGAERHGRQPAGAEAQTIHVGPLSRGALRQLLAMRLDPGLPRWVVRRVIDVAAGNPLLALQIAPELLALPEPLAPDAPLPAPSSLRELLRRRLQRLPEPTQRALLAASALAQPTRELVTVAGLGNEALDSAVDANVIEIEGERIRFTHPLLASVIYSQAPAERRREIHRSLAKVVPEVEERARQLALAADGPNPDAALELERAAALARARGAAPAAAELLERAIALGGAADPRRAARTIAAAEAWIDAGDFERPRDSLEALVKALAPGPERAEALWLLAAVRGEFGHAGASVELLKQARDEAGADDRLSARIEVDLAFMALFNGDLSEGLEHARASVGLAEAIGDEQVLVDALSVFALVHFCAGQPFDEAILDRALRLDQPAGHVRGVGVSPQLARGVILLRTGDLDGARAQFLANRRAAIERGEEGTANAPDFSLGVIEILAGNASRVGEQIREARALAAHTSVKALELAYVEALADGHLGRLEAARRAALTGAAEAERLEERLFVLRYLSLHGFVELSAGRFEAAEESLAKAASLAEAASIGEPGLLEFVPDRVEALIALSRLDDAVAALESYERAANELERPVGIAASLRCRGLLALARGDIEKGVELLERAAAASDGLQIPIERARSLLALGVARRRAKQKRAARESLESALAIFESIEASVWAHRMRDELARIGGRGPRSDELTPTERLVAELVAQGKTNKEAAGELVVTVRAIEANLSRIYAKLGIRSRTELARVYRPEGTRT